MILFFSKTGLEMERKEFMHAESQSRKGRRKGLFFFFFFAKYSLQGGCQQENIG